MGFDTRNGTRGKRQPRGALARWANGFMAGRVAKKGRAPGLPFDALVLTTIGKKSGEPRRVPLGAFPGPDGGWLVVASANGAAKNPAWYYNLAANPDRVTVEVPGRTVAVTAEQLHGPEREEAWRQITTAAPQFAKYETVTDREMPVIKLVPRA